MSAETNVSGVRTTGTGAAVWKSHRVTQMGCMFRVYLLTCSPAGRGHAEQAPGYAVAVPTSSG